MRSHARRARADLGKPCGVDRLARGERRLGIEAECWKIGSQGIGQQPLKGGVVLARGVNLKMPEARERRRYATHHRAGFVARVAVVEHIAHDLLASQDQRQRASSRHAEMMHGLAAQKFAQ